MKKIFQFGEKLDQYDIPVLNEREVRAAAGLLLVGAISTFFYAFLLGNFYPTKVFVVIFLVDFIIRIVINPSFAPSMILGRLIVSNQEVEYVGAPQKKFARIIGLVLALIMFIFLVVLNLVSPINLIICSLCIIFLLFESTFGICLGCLVYNWFTGSPAQLCPGGICKKIPKEPIQDVHISHILVVILFIIFAATIPYLINSSVVQAIGGNNDCVVPEWASAIGHDELWLEHHGCEKQGIINNEQGIIPSNIEDETIDNIESEKAYDPNDPCQNIPEGHPKDLWLIHNGCL